MEEKNIDSFTQALFSNSRLTIANPDFDQILMQKIILQEKRKLARRTLLCAALALLTLGVIIFLVITAIQPTVTGISSGIPAMIKAWIQWITTNQFLLIPFVLLLAFHWLIRGRTRYEV